MSIRKIELITVLENIYSHQGETGHEVVFVHTAEITNPAEFLKGDYSFIDGGILNECRWVSLDDFKSGKLKLFPLGFAEHLIG